MKLLIDIGNTRIKSAVLHQGELLHHHALVHEGLDIEQLQVQLLQRYGAVESVWIANVAGAELAERLTQAVRKLWQLEPTFATSTASFGEVRNAYSQPKKLGVDRWLSLLAVHAAQGSAQVNLIVSIGTAMTLDALAQDGTHRGGLIVPGPDLMTQALLHNTSDIAGFAAGGIPSEKFFADNTLGAIYQGAERACVALIESAFRQLAINESTKLHITGGAAQRILPLLNLPFAEVPDLVLRGLAVLAQN
jgi:type III pantothenate kinase